MEEPMQAPKWGDSLAIRLPASVVEALELKEGDEIEIHVVDEREFGISRKPGREELLRRLRAFRGRLPADFKFDRARAICAGGGRECPRRSIVSCAAS
jgi:antitoxin MazE